MNFGLLSALVSNLLVFSLALSWPPLLLSHWGINCQQRPQRLQKSTVATQNRVWRPPPSLTVPAIFPPTVAGAWAWCNRQCWAKSWFLLFLKVRKDGWIEESHRTTSCILLLLFGVEEINQTCSTLIFAWSCIIKPLRKLERKFIFIFTFGSLWGRCSWERTDTSGGTWLDHLLTIGAAVSVHSSTQGVSGAKMGSIGGSRFKNTSCTFGCSKELWQESDVMGAEHSADAWSLHQMVQHLWLFFPLNPPS